MSEAKHSTGTPCEACGKPIRRGQFVNLYDDVGEVHVDCDAPFAQPKAPTVDEESERELETFVLLGEPLALFKATERGAPPPAQTQAFIDFVEAAGLYIYNNNGPHVLPLKKAWLAAQPHASAALSPKDMGS